MLSKEKNCVPLTSLSAAEFHISYKIIERGNGLLSIRSDLIGFGAFFCSMEKYVSICIKTPKIEVYMLIDFVNDIC